MLQSMAQPREGLRQWRFYVGARGHRPPNLAQTPQFLIGSIVISLSRCCLTNDEGQAPQIFFPSTATGLGHLHLFENMGRVISPNLHGNSEGGAERSGGEL